MQFVAQVDSSELVVPLHIHDLSDHRTVSYFPSAHLKGKLCCCFFKPRPCFWHEIRLSTHREQFGEGRRPLRAI